MTQQLNTLQLNLERTPEALERILRIIRQRSFRVTALNVDIDPNNERNYLIKITLYSTVERDISLIFNQLLKVVGLTNLELL